MDIIHDEGNITRGEGVECSSSAVPIIHDQTGEKSPVIYDNDPRVMRSEVGEESDLYTEQPEREIPSMDVDQNYNTLNEMIAKGEQEHLIDYDGLHTIGQSSSERNLGEFSDGMLSAADNFDEFDDFDDFDDLDRAIAAFEPEAHPTLHLRAMIIQDRGLRPHTKTFHRDNFRGDGYHDQDETGNYDPDAEQHQARTKSRPSRAGDQGAKQRRKRKKAPTHAQGRRMGLSLVVKLGPRSPVFKEALRIFAEENSDTSTVPGIGDCNRNRTDDQDEEKTRRRLGDQLSNAESNHRAESESESEVDDSIALGHPSARGCHSCHKFGLDCSLIQDGMKFPCDQCFEAGCDCILIIPPEQKDVCVRCKNDCLECSYEVDLGVGVSACDECQVANSVCVAGPASSRRMTEVEARGGGKKTGFVPTADRPFLSCSYCRKNKQSCSIKSVKQNSPCATCKIDEVPCTFEALPRTVKTRPSKGKEVEKKDSKRSAEDLKHSIVADGKSYILQQSQGPSQTKKLRQAYERAQQDELDESKDRAFAYVAPPGYDMQRITTSFCHPIEFNFAPQFPSKYRGPRKFQCHLCYGAEGVSGLFYSIFGNGWDPTTVKEKQPLVLRNPHSGSGYVEIEDGWAAEGKEETRVCRTCTFERMAIVFCEGHEIRRIEGVDPTTMDYEKAMKLLLKEGLDWSPPSSNPFVPKAESSAAGEKRGKSALDIMGVRWCSICPYPAFWECCTRPPFGITGAATTEDDDVGCGLILCCICAHRLLGRKAPKFAITRRGKNRGAKAVEKLDDMIHFATTDAFRYPDGLRADVTFLLHDGELMARAPFNFGKDDGLQDAVVAEKEESNFVDLTLPEQTQRSGLIEVIDLT